MRVHFQKNSFLLYLYFNEYILKISHLFYSQLIKEFFNNPCAEMWFLFVQSQAAVFYSTVLQVEGQNVSSFEVATVLSGLHQKYEERLENKCLPLVVRNCIKHVEEAVDKEYIIETI